MSKYFLMALAAILAGIGGYALIDGWSIVQVERGWSQVIAGATALSAAAIVLAIALLLRAVEALALRVQPSQQLQRSRRTCPCWRERKWNRSSPLARRRARPRRLPNRCFARALLQTPKCLLRHL